MKRTLILILSFMPLLAFGQNTVQRFILVRGESEINIVPDRIELSIFFSENEKLKGENKLKEKESELVKLLTEFSIDLKKMTVDNFIADRGFYYKSYWDRARMSKLYKLKLENLDIADSLIVRLLQIGADRVSVTDLQNDRIEETKLEAARIALDKAKKKAELMASHLNCSIGEVLEISEFRPQGSASIEINSWDNKNISAYGANRVYDNGEEGIGIKKIKVVYVVDVKYELK